MFHRLALVLLCAAPAAAQPLPALVTDRPDFTESGVVVPRGHVQVETGATAAFFTTTSTLSGPELLARWTPLDRFELRFGAPDYIGGSTWDVAGFGDPSLGVKVQLGPLDGWDLGLIATASLPLGDEVMSSGTVDPELILTTGRALSARSSLGAQLSAARDGLLDAWTIGGTLVIGLDLSERWGTFFELATWRPEVGGDETLLHHGYTLGVGPDLQLDVHAALGLTETAPDFLLGLGFTARR